MGRPALPPGLSLSPPESKEETVTRNAPTQAAVFGIDLGKTLFHVVGLDERGEVIQRAKFRRETPLQFFDARRAR
jgi:hypothetical protein